MARNNQVGVVPCVIQHHIIIFYLFLVLNQKSDDGGRQISLSVEMYTTDVLNILTETGGFSIVAQSSSSSGEIFWSLQK